MDKFRDPPVASFSTFEGLGNSRPQGVLAGRDGTIWVANFGALDHIDKNGTISSIRIRDGLPGNQVASMLEDRGGNMWVGVDDGLYLFRNGRSAACNEQISRRLGLSSGSRRTSKETFGQSASASRRSLCVSVISKSAKISLRRRVPTGLPSRRIHREEFG